MAPTATASRLDLNYWTVRAQPRVSVSSLARSKDWKEKLAKGGPIEVLDRGDTCAWLVSPEDMDELMTGYTHYQDALEQASMKAMIDARTEDRTPLTDEALKQAVREAFADRMDVLGSRSDGN